MSGDLVRRLRESEIVYASKGTVIGRCKEAAIWIEQLEAENGRLRAGGAPGVSETHTDPKEDR